MQAHALFPPECARAQAAALAALSCYQPPLPEVNEVHHLGGGTDTDKRSSMVDVDADAGEPPPPTSTLNPTRRPESALLACFREGHRGRAAANRACHYLI